MGKDTDEGFAEYCISCDIGVLEQNWVQLCLDKIDRKTFRGLGCRNCGKQYVQKKGEELYILIMKGGRVNKVREHYYRDNIKGREIEKNTIVSFAPDVLFNSQEE